MTALLDPTETQINMSAAAREIPKTRGDSPPHPSTPLRWILRGVRLRDGTRLKLAAIRSPGGWITTREAVARFLSALTEDSLPQDDAAPAIPTRTPTQRQKASDAAGRQLSAIGI